MRNFYMKLFTNGEVDSPQLLMKILQDPRIDRVEKCSDRYALHTPHGTVALRCPRERAEEGCVELERDEHGVWSNGKAMLAADRFVLHTPLCVFALVPDALPLEEGLAELLMLAHRISSRAVYLPPHVAIPALLDERLRRAGLRMRPKLRRRKRGGYVEYWLEPFLVIR